MASLSLSSLPLGPTPLLLPGNRRSRRRALLCRSSAGSGAAVVWMKRDLRTDDHPGIAAAVAEGRRVVVPVYVFDRRILSGFSDEMLELLLFALEDLRKLLKDQGSDLLIGLGSAEDMIPKLVNEVKATHVFVEEEVEYNLRRVTETVESSLSSVDFSWGDPKFVFWRTPFYDVENLKELPASYNAFQKLKLSLSNPIPSPTLPLLDMKLDRGTLPSFDDVKKYLNAKLNEENGTLASLKEISAEALLRRKRRGQSVNGTDIVNGIESFEVVDADTRWTLAKSVFASQRGTLVRGGTNIVLNGLAAYLRYLEGTSRDDYQELHEKLRMAETRDGASFGALFRASLYFGIISRRRVHYEAIKYEKERNAGFVSPFGYSASTVAAAVETVCSMEWYWLLALRSQTCNEAIYPIRIWNWKGYLIQYIVVGDEGPAILFVHGFGAFLEHFRDNISSMAAGHRVWGITLLGFGRSEKPNLAYSELTWTELLRDFIVDVVGEPVHLVGNSIGGYFVASVAGLWPALAKSVVLINTAGAVVPDYSRAPLVEPRNTSENGFAWLGSRLLLLYLKLRAGNILKNCYPNNTRRVDGWLINEILRASYDPGAAVVLESVFNFNLRVPLNFYLDSFRGKVLVIQGMRDPLSSSKLRLSKIREHCNWITIRELDAGHCPHDEVPEEVNGILREWTRKCETESNLQTAKAN